jgi:hypothetical protein
LKVKWCKPGVIVKPNNIRWYVEWEWGNGWNTTIWCGMVDGTVVRFSWYNLRGYPEPPMTICIEYDSEEGLRKLLRDYEKDHDKGHIKVVGCGGELPQELLAICARPTTQ